MSVAVPTPWTAAQFLSWAAAHEQRHEFDGTAPVAVTGGTARHSRITTNIHAALRMRLRGTGCAFFGPDLGMQAGEAIRYPDALITCTGFADTAQLAPDVRVVFEVTSPSTARTDRIIKVREYAGVASLRRYVIVESRFAGLLVLHRAAAGDPWTAVALTAADVLPLPEAGIDVPVAEFYDDVVWPEDADAAAPSLEASPRVTPPA